MAATRKVRRKTYAPDNPVQARKMKAAAKPRGVDQDARAFRQARRNMLKAAG